MSASSSSPYDLSDPMTSASEPTPRSQQTSPQNLVTSDMTAPSDNFLTDCKYSREESSCSVKMEQQQHQHHPQQPQQHQQQQLPGSSVGGGPPSQYRCDPKYDNQSFTVGQTPLRYGMDSSASAYSTMPGSFMPPSSGMPGSSYQYAMHRQNMFNPIPAAVPSEQGWERYG